MHLLGESVCNSGHFSTCSPLQCWQIFNGQTPPDTIALKRYESLVGKAG